MISQPCPSGDDLTFENTLIALESAYESLSRPWGLVSHLDSVSNSDQLREAYNAMLPKVSEFYSKVPLNSELWNRIDELRTLELPTFSSLNLNSEFRNL